MAALVALAAALVVCGCGGAGPRRTGRSHPAPPPADRPAFGITEDNANLLWAPGAAAPPQAAPFLAARRGLAALHPRYLRLLIDWAALQPTPGSPPALSAPVDGCARGVPPCGAYPGVEGELAAIASRQRLARARGEAAPQVLLDILAAPVWATLPHHGCEASGTDASAGTLSPDGLAAYRALIAALVALGRRVGVALPWWSPWNEPDNPRFLGPQRAACTRSAPALAPGAYAQLARAMAGELKEVDGGAQILLGELAGNTASSPGRLGLAEFVEAVPEDVLCLSHDWSVHAYAAYGRRGAEAAREEPVFALERALDGRGGCAAGARIWITEAGVGAPRPGRPRSGSPPQEAAGFAALGEQLSLWSADRRVAAIFQYTFREDPAYPVGLMDPSLDRTYPSYSLWDALANAAASGAGHDGGATGITSTSGGG